MLAGLPGSARGEAIYRHYAKVRVAAAGLLTANVLKESDDTANL